MGESVLSFLRSLSLAIMVVATSICVTATLGAAIGWLPWLEFTARFELFEVAEAGQITQIAVTTLLVALCFFVPAANRMLVLERSHRQFRICMDDVEHAYRAAHAADRAGHFKAGSQFDAVRERMEYLRDHPDLTHLEGPLLDVAAQMSERSRDLAQTYSNANLNRARAFLQQRQEEMDAFSARLDAATRLTQDLRRWSDALETEAGVQQAQVERLQRDLLELLPELGFEVEEDDPADNVVQMQSLPAPQPRPHS